MTYTKSTVQEFLATVDPFDRLAPESLSGMTEQFQLLRYRIGQAVLVRDRLPNQVSIIYQGQIRLLGYDPRTQKPVTLSLLQPGAVIGWVGLVRGVACETAIASRESICLTISAADFLGLLKREPQLADAFRNRCSPIEIYDLLGTELHRQANGSADLKDMTLRSEEQTVICNLPPGKTPISQLESDRIWIVSGGGEISGFPVGSRISLNRSGMSSSDLEVTGNLTARIIGIPEAVTQTVQDEIPLTDDLPAAVTPDGLEIPYAPDRPAEPEPGLSMAVQQAPQKFPFVRGKGELEVAIACLKMLCQHFNMPFRQDVVRRVLVNQMQRSGGISLELCGAVAEMMGVHAQLVGVPASAVGRLEAPAMVQWQDSFALLYSINEREMVIAVPEMGIIRRKPADFISDLG